MNWQQMMLLRTTGHPPPHTVHHHHHPQPHIVHNHHPACMGGEHLHPPHASHACAHHHRCLARNWGCSCFSHASCALLFFSMSSYHILLPSTFFSLDFLPSPCHVNFFPACAVHIIIVHNHQVHHAAGAPLGCCAPCLLYPPTPPTQGVRRHMGRARLCSQRGPCNMVRMMIAVV